MALTRLGWDVLTSGSSSRLTNLSWITGKVRSGDAHTILNELGRRFNSEVETIRKDLSWGYAYRNVRGASIHSEHSAGTSVDFNAPAHGLGRVGTFSGAQVKAIRRILADLDGAVRWGGDYAVRKDEMHFELQGGTAKLAKVAAKINGGVKPVGNVKPSKPKPKPVRNTKEPSAAVKKKLKNMGYPKQGIAEVKAYQDWHGLVPDGDWGDRTEAKYQEVVRAQNATKKLKNVPGNWKSDGYWGATSKKLAGYASDRNGWGNPKGNLVPTYINNLKKAKAW